MKTIERFVCFSLLVGMLLAAAGCVGPGVRDSRRVGRTDLPVLAVPRTDTPPVIDGDPSDEAWKRAAVIGGLRPALGGGYEDRIDAVPTVIRALWDADFLYVCFECVDADVFSAEAMEHDGDLYKEDVCEVFLDGKGDGKQYVEVEVSPRGRTLDLMHVLSDVPRHTKELRLEQRFVETDRWIFREWEMKGLQAAAGRLLRGGTAAGWTAEMAIPAGPIVKRLGLKTYQPGELRANFMRYDYPLDPKTGKREMLHMNWSPVVHGCPHISPAAMGRLKLTE